MQLIQSTSFFCLVTVSLISCSGLTSRFGGKQDSAPANTAQQLIDTAKLQADMNNVLNSLASGKPDTNALKKAGSDVLTTASQVLSDSGIDKLYGNSNDPAIRAAAATLKKFRNATGATPAALDSMRKAADLLKAN